MNYVKAGILFFVFWIVQTTLLWRIWPFGATPNLLLCAAVSFAWLYDRGYALVYAVIFGLLLDIQVQSLFGVHGLALVLCMVPAMLQRRGVNPERTLPVAFAALLATLINAFVVWGVNSLFYAPHSIMLVIETLPSLIISQIIICTILHILFVRTIIKDRKDRRYAGGVM